MIDAVEREKPDRIFFLGDHYRDGEALADLYPQIPMTAVRSNCDWGLAPDEEEILLDKTGKKNGRGAYVCKNGECLQKAMKSKGLERSFKMSIPKEVYVKLEEEFKKIEAE